MIKPLRETLRRYFIDAPVIKMGSPADRLALSSPSDRLAEWRPGAPLFDEEVALLARITVGSHDNLREALINYATQCQAESLYAAAAVAWSALLRLFLSAPGFENEMTLKILTNLAACHEALGDWWPALPLYEEALRLQEAALGPDHPDTRASEYDLLACRYRFEGPERP